MRRNEAAVKLGSFGDRGGERPALIVDGAVLPIDWIMEDNGRPAIGTIELLSGLRTFKPLLEAAIPTARRLPLAGVRLGPAIPAPRNILAVGFNYRMHGDKIVDTMPNHPILFMKPTSAITGPYDDIVKPGDTRQLDYELELAVVIGREAYGVTAKQAIDHIAGYAAANDISARDISLGESHIHPLFLQMTRGKGAPGFCPLGPWMVTPDELPSIPSLTMKLWVNDELRQNDHCSSMIVGVADMISSLSASIRLLPGDIILTGTPGGCAFQMREPRFLEPGDTVRGTIDGLGEMRNRIVDPTDVAHPGCGRPFA